ncbi:MAG: Uracil-DNA glycosylase [Chlamydiae bacterium]|nr:Uracil-DNA glycosylase [Chlamydiota bacterium]
MTLPPPQLEESWKEALSEEWKKPYLQKLAAFVAKERTKFPVYPPKNEVFSAFEHTPYDKVKVVIIVVLAKAIQAGVKHRQLRGQMTA